MTTNKPATPLPWIATKTVRYRRNHGLFGGELEGAGVAGFGLKTVAHIPKRNHDDAAHIAHVANAYPKLVEALRDLMRDEKLDDDDPKLIATREQCGTLLRELGEL